MTSQYIGDNVRKSSSTDPREIFFLVSCDNFGCFDWLSGRHHSKTTWPRTCKQVLSVAIFACNGERVRKTDVLTRPENSIHLENDHGFSYSSYREVGRDYIFGSHRILIDVMK